MLPVEEGVVSAKVLEGSTPFIVTTRELLLQSPGSSTEALGFVIEQVVTPMHHVSMMNSVHFVSVTYT